MNSSINFKDFLFEEHKDEAYAKEYLELALADSQTDNDPMLFQTALRDVIQAHGSVPAFVRNLKELD